MVGVPTLRRRAVDSERKCGKTISFLPSLPSFSFSSIFSCVFLLPVLFQNLAIEHDDSCAVGFGSKSKTVWDPYAASDTQQNLGVFAK